MEILAIVLIVLGVLIGITMAIYVFKGQHIPKALAIFHGAAVVLGVVLLLINAFSTESHHKHWESIIIFAAAAIGGGYMFGRDIRHKKFPVWLMVVHAILGLGGLILLTTRVMG